MHEKPTQTEKQTPHVTETSAIATLTRLATRFGCAIEDVEDTVLAAASPPPPKARTRIFHLEQAVKRVEAERDSVLFTLSKLETEVATLQGEREAAALEQDRLAALEAPLQKAWPFITAADWMVMQQTVFRLREALAALRHVNLPDDALTPTVTSAQRESVNAQADMLKTATEKCLDTPNKTDTYHALYQLRRSHWPHVSEHEWNTLLQTCIVLSEQLDAHRDRINRLERRYADDIAALEKQTCS